MFHVNRMRESNSGAKRMNFAVKADFFLSMWDPPAGRPHTSLSLPHSAANSTAAPPHSRASPVQAKGAPSLSHSLKPLSLSPSNPRSRSRIEVCMWYHCDHKLTSIPFLQFVCSFPKDLSRFGCLLVLGLKSEERRNSSISHRFLHHPTDTNLHKCHG